MKMLKSGWPLHLGLVAAGLLIAGQVSATEVEVMHWWTSGSESAAVAQFKTKYESKGYQWKDVAAGGGDNERILLKSRLLKGNPPAAAIIDTDVKQFDVDRSKLADLNQLAAQQHWDSVLPTIVQHYVKINGQYVAVPVNVHRQNVMWISVAAMKKIGASEPPKTWADWFVLADKAKAAGIMPLAAAENWTTTELFQQIAYGSLGADGYRKAFYEGNAEALQGSSMIKAFQTLRRIKPYTDKAASTRTWDAATHMVIEGKALSQAMGDWAKGEFLMAKQKPGQDFLCVPMPGTSTGFLFNVDAFMFFKVKDQDQQAQNALATTFMSKDGQEAFNKIKGSVPVRTDADMSQFDDCGKQSHADFLATAKSGTLTMAAEQLASPARVSGWEDVVQAFWASDDMTPEQAAEKMAAVAKANK
ncbi:ABC transporter substrate-binding protein [Burkholderia sp. LMG 21824]|uniref:ABC transporter substrate-binding protein n=1 Tax=Burkholderia sp. LMG 21824 TaxID=3158172 RepID=UPI003C2B5726